MPEMRELEAFEEAVRRAPAARAFVEETAGVATSVATESAPMRFDVGPQDAWLLALAALWQIVKIGIDHLRALSETKLVEQRIKIVEELAKSGGDKKAAEAIVEAQLSSIQSRAVNDSVLEDLKKLG